MQIWLDTTNVNIINQSVRMGLLVGVTTTLSSVAHSKEPLEDLLEKLLHAQSGPIAVQVSAKEAEEIIRQGEALYSFSNRLIPKIPVTAQGIEAICSLRRLHMPVMASAIFEPSQILMAAQAGANFLVPYYSHMCEDEMNGNETIKAMLHLLKHYGFSSKMLVSDISSKEQVSQCATLGAHGVALNEKVFSQLIEDHPSTKERLDRNARDWLHAKERRTLLL